MEHWVVLHSVIPVSFFLHAAYRFSGILLPPCCIQILRHSSSYMLHTDSQAFFFLHAAYRVSGVRVRHWLVCHHRPRQQHGQGWVRRRRRPARHLSFHCRSASPPGCVPRVRCTPMALTHSLLHTHTHAHAHSLTHTHTHAHTRTFSLSFHCRSASPPGCVPRRRKTCRVSLKC